MALVATTLTSDITASALSIPVASVTGATVGRKVRINNEVIGSILEVVALTVKVRGRGDSGTMADAHQNSSPVTFGDPADFGPVVPASTEQVPQDRDQGFITAVTGAIPLPEGMRDSTQVLTGPSAGAYTLAAPSLAQDGVRLTLIGGSAFAHVITATPGVFEGTTGGAHVTLTSAAFTGSTLVLQALKGSWYVVSNALWVLT
jgi:hypothetical protein